MNIEWLIANQLHIVFACMIFANWITVQILKTPFKKFITSKIENMALKNIIESIIIVPICCGGALLWAYVYNLIYSQYLGMSYYIFASIIAGCTFIADTVGFRVIINIFKMLYDKFKKNEKVTKKDFQDILTPEAKETKTSVIENLDKEINELLKK